MPACLFQNGGCLLLMVPPRGGWGWAKSGLVVLMEGGYRPSAKGGGKFSPSYCPLCWSVGEWVGAS